METLRNHGVWVVRRRRLSSVRSELDRPVAARRLIRRYPGRDPQPTAARTLNLSEETTGRDGSPHKSWCRSTVIAEIFRSPRTHPPLAQDDRILDLSIAPDRFFAQVPRSPRCESRRSLHTFSG